MAFSSVSAARSTELDATEPGKSDPAAPMVQPLGRTNFVNLAAYAVNLIITYVSLTGVFGQTNSALSKKYQTLVTPKGVAFSIWGPIFIWEFLFAVAQMTPRFRGSKFVPVVAPWWCAACAFQVAWTLLFAQEQIALALICMFGILGSLVGLMWSADAIEGVSIPEYWVLRAPFSLHGGWIIAASAVNTSVQADFMKASASSLLSIAIASLAAVFAVTVLYAIAAPKPDAIICLVVAWATGFIAAELGDPKDLMNQQTRHNYRQWDSATLSGVGGAARALSWAALVLAALALSLRSLRAFGINLRRDAEASEVPTQALGA